MNKETKTKYTISIGCFFIGIFYLLEGLSVTRFGEKVKDVPDLMIVLVGFVLLIVGMMMLIGKEARLNNFFASILSLVMGLMSGWASLFGKSTGLSSNDFFISYITGLPLDRIIFGIGSVLSFVISVIAFRMFLKPKSSKE